MHRDLMVELIRWKNAKEHMPLLLRGARQVGKTHLAVTFGQTHFENMLIINFEKEEKYKLAFDTLNPKDILNRLYLQSGHSVQPGKSLLFLDEIQECTQALKSLRYFKEDMPELHVIAAGSLLEFTLNSENMRMPVGRVESLFVKPLSFYEYLSALGFQHLRQYLNEVTLKTPIEPTAHDELCEHLRNYFFIGGLPNVLNEYLSSHNLERVQIKQLNLAQTYRDDFGKYANKTKHQPMKTLLSAAPNLIGKKFIYSKVDPDIGSREIKIALNYLVEAGLLYKVHHTNASGLPLNALASEKHFKVIFLDIGLSNASSQLSPETFLQKDLLLLNRGIQTEQFSGQELLAYCKPYIQSELFYWDREKQNSSAEVDYVINVNDHIIPIEVKAGKTGSLRSLQIFLNEKNAQLGVRLSLKPLELHSRILSIPLYMIAEIPRLVMAQMK
ncbi:MAG: ATP-binding protein [Gammaproteobacteria bacterium]|nr:ATP-binding protein [Gammaproteobacteria bacterium]